MTPSCRPARLVRSLAAAALLFTACDQGPRAPSDLYDVSTMDLKPTPAKLSSERHQGAFAEGSSLSLGASSIPTGSTHSPAGSVKASGGH